MKFMIASDIHGSTYYTKRLLERFDDEKPEKLILLGDLYYHGPRNPLSEEYSPMDVSNLLNSIKDKLIVVRGNCDSEVDEMISDFPFEISAEIWVGDKKVNLTHGHRYNKDNLPPNCGDILVYGHLHTGFIIRENGKIFANPGSTSLPKNGTKNSYLIIDENVIILKDMDGNVLKEEKI